MQTHIHHRTFTSSRIQPRTSTQIHLYNHTCLTTCTTTHPHLHTTQAHKATGGNRAIPKPQPPDPNNTIPPAAAKQPLRPQIPISQHHRQQPSDREQHARSKNPQRACQPTPSPHQYYSPVTLRNGDSDGNSNSNSNGNQGGSDGRDRWGTSASRAGRCSNKAPSRSKKGPGNHRHLDHQRHAPAILP